jgi:hypothetical protein
VRIKKQTRLFMETTHIDPQKTVGEIQEVLGKYGASAIRMDYQDGPVGREVVSVSFTIEVNRDQVPFRLPCRWISVLNALMGRIRGERSDEYLEKKREEYTPQAKRIAWRQILRWVEAQLALVETGMVKMVEVFVPYMLMDKGKTLYEKLEETQFKMLEYQSKEHK